MGPHTTPYANQTRHIYSFRVQTPSGDDLPAPLIVAASLAAVEGLVLVVLAVAELVSFSSDRAALGLTTAAFFAAAGVALVFCGYAVTRLRPWARSPILLAQLIQLGLAWNFRHDPTTLVAIALAVVAAVTLAGLLHPASIEALTDDPR